MSYIIEGLYLGSEDDVYDFQKLQKIGITHLLSVNIKPVPLEVRGELCYKYVYAVDTQNQDLLSKTEECLDFIEQGRGDGGVLVHCFAGVSRSATMVLAYLMHKMQMSLREALGFVQIQRPQIGPNSGFMEQLQLYEDMGCKIDPKHLAYRTYKLQRLAEVIQRDQRWEDLSSDSLIADPTLTSSTTETVYKCRKCRRSLFMRSAILEHSEGIGAAAFRYVPAGHTEPDQATHTRPTCTESLFVEPVAWMREHIQALEGKLMCPKCRSKIGSFTWMGERCSCGQWITPAFHLSQPKVDECRPRQTLFTRTPQPPPDTATKPVPLQYLYSTSTDSTATKQQESTTTVSQFPVLTTPS